MFKDRLLTTIFLLEIWLLLLQILLIGVSFGSLPESVPLWYTEVWGQAQLAPRFFLFVFPIIGLAIFFANNYLCEKISQRKEVLSARSLALTNVFLITGLTLFIFRIVLSISLPHLPWFLSPLFILTLSSSFILSSLLTYPSLWLSQKLGFVDNPQTHRHPAMLLTRAVPRGGALPLFLGFLLPSLFLFQPDRKVLLVLLVGGLAILIGLLDDKYDLNPYLRFGLQILAASLLVGSGLQIDYINHPLGQGVLALTKPVLTFGHQFSFSPLAAIFALLWILWTMNMISWSNGVDGQLPLIIAVAAVVIGVLGGNDTNQFKTSVMSFALAGAALGTLPYSWFPSKILYGFGAAGLGLILAALSILNGTKIATALLVLLVPSLDALFTILRRMRSGRSPFWGDRAHFHHKLLDLGFSQRQIALFYGLVGAVLGSLAILLSGRGKLLALTTAAGLFIFLLTLVNLGTERGKE